MIQVTAAIIAENGKVLIAKRKPAGRLPNLWEFPGGKLEEGEIPEQCLERELQEEFEVDAEVGDYLGTSLHKYDFGTIELMAYRTQVFNIVFKLKDHSEVAWVEPKDLSRYEFAPADLPFVEMIRWGEIKL
jgi:8-oxo-dGTP diphosphatase